MQPSVVGISTIIHMLYHEINQENNFVILTKSNNLMKCWYPQSNSIVIEINVKRVI